MKEPIYLFFCLSLKIASSALATCAASRPVKSIATTVFLAYCDGMVAACYLQVRNSVIVTGEMLS